MSSVRVTNEGQGMTSRALASLHLKKSLSFFFFCKILAETSYTMVFDMPDTNFASIFYYNNVNFIRLRKVFKNVP